MRSFHASQLLAVPEGSMLDICLSLKRTVHSVTMESMDDPFLSLRYSIVLS